MPAVELNMGEHVQVIKLHPFGHEVTRYPGVVLDRKCPPPWIAIEAMWVNQRVDANGLIFEPGDTVIEYFSPDNWFNVFHLYARDGSNKGWYANVTYPTRVESGPEGAEVTWHDLFLDLIKLTGQPMVLCDADELDESGLAKTDPLVYERIQETIREMQFAAAADRFPFREQTR